ncbi:MAG: GntR family transcriptional regulator [Marvinbryantia sp.]
MEKKVKYREVADLLKQKILDGEFTDGEKLATENELARLYQVSRHTIRQALGVLEQEERIRRVQGSGNYIQMSGSSRQRKKSKCIAVNIRYVREYIFPDLLRGIQEELIQNGYTMLLFSTNNRVEQERKNLLECMNQNVAAILTDGTRSALPNPNASLYRQIKESGIPVLFMDSSYSGLEDFPTVGIDDFQAAKTLTEFFLKRGCERISCIFKVDSRTGQQRYAGYDAAMLEYGSMPPDEAVTWYSTGKEDEVLGEDYMKRYAKADAVICYNDRIAKKLIDRLLQRNVRIPEEVQVGSFDNSIYSELSAVRITSMNHPKEEMGREAVRKLMEMLKGKKVESVQFSMELVEKDSSKK